MSGKDVAAQVGRQRAHHQPPPHQGSGSAPDLARPTVATYSFTDEEYQEAERNGLALNPKSTGDKADDTLFDEAIGEIYHRQMELRRADQLDACPTSYRGGADRGGPPWLPAHSASWESSPPCSSGPSDRADRDLLDPIIKLLGKLIGHVFATIGRGSATSSASSAPSSSPSSSSRSSVLNILIGRWSASAHYGRALTDECKTAGACVYRIAIGHPLHLIGLRALTEGIEHRLPNAVAYAPGPDKPSKKRQGLFEGYTIVGSLPGGGSGGKLYIAEPDELKRAAFARRGINEVDRVVIKTFSLTDGSSLPQIVRESRALDAAKKLGLVLEHELTDERFYYIMRYVPGDSLTVATQNLHAEGRPAGLDAAASGSPSATPPTCSNPSISTTAAACGTRTSSPTTSSSTARPTSDAGRPTSSTSGSSPPCAAR
jgi:hypothetical protein